MGSLKTAMNRQNYLAKPEVQSFINWLQPRISGEAHFYHKYYNYRGKQHWDCHSIFNAYEKYNWSFKCTLPELGACRGQSFEDSKRVMTNISKGLKDSMESKNNKGVLQYGMSVLEWGGVKRNNDKRLLSFGDNLVVYFEIANAKLNPSTTHLGLDFRGIEMNAGFTKIYSLLLDDFVIYDSRVGAALGWLVRLFLTENGIPDIPEALNFAYGKARPTVQEGKGPNRRDPSNANYHFKALTNNAPKHIKYNTMANWLLKEVADNSIFSQTDQPIRSLEAALFMIGYAVR
jgi:hypothetical protein